MKYSSLSTVLTLDSWCKYEKKFKENYKKEEGESFKGSVAQYITSGVIKRKKLPDVEDEITLIKLLNGNATDEQAYAKLSQWLEDEENRKRGIAGAFCDSCKDLCIAVPIHPVVIAEIDDLEDTINNIQEAMLQMNKMIQSISNLRGKLSEIKTEEVENEAKPVENTEELGVDNKDTQEDK